MTRFFALSALLALSGCATGNAACEATSDADADGIDDCAEEALGTDPNLADSDGDGVNDGAEVDCVSDPLDGAEVCYECGWPHGDPGDLTGVGPNEGDTIANLSLVDACGEDVGLWDLAGEYHILFLTAAWCGVCKAEVREHENNLEVHYKRSSVPVDYVVVLFEDVRGGLPDAQDAANYVSDLNILMPTFSDPSRQVIDQTPYRGDRLPGKCVLSPDMELLDCWSGATGDEAALEMIRAHAGE